MLKKHYNALVYYHDGLHSPAQSVQHRMYRAFCHFNKAIDSLLFNWFFFYLRYCINVHRCYKQVWKQSYTTMRSTNYSRNHWIQRGEVSLYGCGLASNSILVQHSNYFSIALNLFCHVMCQEKPWYILKISSSLKGKQGPRSNSSSLHERQAMPANIADFEVKSSDFPELGRGVAACPPNHQICSSPSAPAPAPAPALHASPAANHSKSKGSNGKVSSVSFLSCSTNFGSFSSLLFAC